MVIIAAVLSSIMIMTSNDPSPGNAKLLMIAFSFIFFGITGSICWATARKSEHSILGNAGMIISAVAFLYSTILILGEVESTSMLKMAFCFFIASFALAHISFLFYVNVKNKYASIARIVATLFISFFSLLIISKMFESDSNFFLMGLSAGIDYMRLVFTSLILDLAATLLVPLCNQLDVNAAPMEFEIDSEQQPPSNDHTI